MPAVEVNVIAPVGTSTEEIIEKVKSRVAWIVSKQYESKFINDTKINRETVGGEYYICIGRNYYLDIIIDEELYSINVKLFQGKFVVNTYNKDKDLIKKYLKNRRKDGLVVHLRTSCSLIGYVPWLLFL